MFKKRSVKKRIITISWLKNWLTNGSNCKTCTIIKHVYRYFYLYSSTNHTSPIRPT